MLEPHEWPVILRRGHASMDLAMSSLHKGHASMVLTKGLSTLLDLCGSAVQTQMSLPSARTYKHTHEYRKPPLCQAVCAEDIPDFLSKSLMLTNDKPSWPDP